jgi:DnaA family protein
MYITFGVGVKKLMIAQPIKQLPLPIKLNYSYKWQDFFWDENTNLQSQINMFITQKAPQFMYIWGVSGAGKSHLLQAIAKEHQAIYLPLNILKDYSVECLDSLDEQAILLIDDLETVAGNKEWELKLFELFNKIYDNGLTQVIITNNCPPADCQITLADLKSRLHWGLIMQIHEMNDSNKALFLNRYAASLGIKLEYTVIDYLLRQYSRDMTALLDIIQKLDQASLIAKRKITIPFINKILR